MAAKSFQLEGSRPRIIGENSKKYVGRDVIVLGEAISINMKANTINLRMPDDETIIVLLQHNTTTIEPNLLTEVHGKLISRGNIEAVAVIQFAPQDATTFNKKLYCEMSQVMDAFPDYYIDI